MVWRDVEIFWVQLNMCPYMIKLSEMMELIEVMKLVKRTARRVDKL